MKKNSRSFRSGSAPARSAMLRIGAVPAWKFISEPRPTNCISAPCLRQTAFRRARIASPRAFSAVAAAGV